jgi:hypothetical protein
MLLPDYYLKRPALELSTATIATFEQLYTDYVEAGTAQEINYELAAPKWQFLCYLCDTKRILLHGSGNPDITEFEPRQPNDVEEFSNRRAVYAASDGIWPMYFAIVKRKQVTLLMNACFKILKQDSGEKEAYYYFSVDQAALPQYPWQNGMVYLLPGATFEQQPLQDYMGLQVEITQWASPVAVKPLAKLPVSPADFPFLEKMNGHDPQLISERASRNPKGFPWRE